MVLVSDSGGGGAMPATTVAGVALTGLGVISGVIAGVVEIAIDAAQVEEIKGHLEDARKSLADARGQLKMVPAGAVGGSPMGKQLAHHSGLASDALRDTLDTMEATVEQYRAKIEEAVARLTDADEGSGATSRRGETYVGPNSSGSRDS